MSLARRLHHATSGAGLSFPFVSTADTTIANLMASWWCTPKAVESGGRIWVSGVEAAGANKVYSFDRADPTDIDSFTLMTNESDDHNAAALLVPTDKVPLVFYCRHNKDAILRWRKGTTIGDITSLGAEQQFTFPGALTYVQMWRRPGTDEVHLWTREVLRYWRNKYTTDWTTSWSTSRRVFDFGSGQQGYIGTVPTAADGDVLRVALTGHPTSSTIHDIYYCEIDMGTGDITSADGATTHGNLKDGTGLPISVTATLEKIVDTDTAGGHNARLFDVGDGPEPEVVWGDWTTDTDMVYHRTAYSGGSWTADSIVAAGVTFGYLPSIHYNGGVMFPQDTPGGLVYLSREDAGTWTIEQWDDSGGWSRTKTLATSAATKVVRPQPVRDPTGGVLTWHDVSVYPTTATASLDWEADTVVDGG